MALALGLGSLGVLPPGLHPVTYAADTPASSQAGKVSLIYHKSRSFRIPFNVDGRARPRLRRCSSGSRRTRASLEAQEPDDARRSAVHVPGRARRRILVRGPDLHAWTTSLPGRWTRQVEPSMKVVVDTIAAVAGPRARRPAREPRGGPLGGPRRAPRPEVAGPRVPGRGAPRMAAGADPPARPDRRSELGRGHRRAAEGPGLGRRQGGEHDRGRDHRCRRGRRQPPGGRGDAEPAARRTDLRRPARRSRRARLPAGRTRSRPHGRAARPRPGACAVPDRDGEARRPGLGVAPLRPGPRGRACGGEPGRRRTAAPAAVVRQPFAGRAGRGVPARPAARAGRAPARPAACTGGRHGRADAAGRQPAVRAPVRRRGRRPERPGDRRALGHPGRRPDLDPPRRGPGPGLAVPGRPRRRGDLRPLPGRPLAPRAWATSPRPRRPAPDLGRGRQHAAGVQLDPPQVGTGPNSGKVAIPWRATDLHLAPQPVVDPLAARPARGAVAADRRGPGEHGPVTSGPSRRTVPPGSTSGSRSPTPSATAARPRPPNAAPIIVDRSRPRSRIIGLDPNARTGARPAAHRRAARAVIIAPVAWTIGSGGPIYASDLRPPARAGP